MKRFSGDFCPCTVLLLYLGYMPIFEGGGEIGGGKEGKREEPPHLTTWHAITSGNDNDNDK